MSPSVTISTNEINASGGSVGATGTAFIPVVTDQGPLTGPLYSAVGSINQYTSSYGPRSSTSAVAYDWLDEFFQDGGQLAYVTRVTDNTATAAALTLDDAGSNPSVVVTASPGNNGNGYYVVVTRGTAPTFTMLVASGTKNCTAVSSFANIGVGTPITGTGIAANTYITAINVAAATCSISNNATASATETITPATFTTTIQDINGNVYDTHGPYNTTAQLIADTTSAVVAFSQSAGSGFTDYVPVASSATALTGGANANDLTVASSVTALANFPASLGPGTVAIPGYPNSTAWTGILSHCEANNRFGVLDLADSSSSASVVSEFGTITTNGSYGMAIEGSLTLPGIIPSTTRTTNGSAAVAALRAQVGQTSNQNQAPAGPNWPLTYPIGFTEYFGPGGSFAQADVNTMSTAGVNCFAIYQGVPCLFGYVTPVSSTSDVTYWQATASCERMALVYDGTNAIAPFLFATLDGSNKTLIAAQTALQAVIANHWSNGALYGDNASDAGQVNMGAPINTPTTEEAGQLNANLQVHISPFANTINETITTVPITVAVV